MGGPTDRGTRDGQTLTVRMWAMLEDAYRSIGLNPAQHLYVTKGSWKETTATSGSTHNGAGAADLRVWVLPASAQENLCRDLVVAIRARGGCAWFRDAVHGGFDPHIHVIDRFEPGISDAAAWQVAEYDRGHDGLSAQNADYHPRPKQTEFVMNSGGIVPPVTGEDGDMPIILRKGNSVFRLLSGGKLANISQASVDNLVKAGVKVVAIPNSDWFALERAFGTG